MDKNAAIQKLKAWWATKQDVQMYRTALTGDGSTASTCDVGGKEGWAWVLYDEKQDKASMVVNQVMPGAPQGVPVVIGKKYPHDKYYQILGVNMQLYYEHTSPTEYVSYLLPKHGSTHQYESSDPAWITLGNLLPGSVSATTPNTMFVTGNALVYEYGGVAVSFTGGNIDLTATIPPLTGTHRYVLIAINMETNALAYVMGTPAPLPVTPAIPSFSMKYLPLAVVMVADTATSIEQASIFQYKYLFGSSMYLYCINKVAGDYSNEMDIELTLHQVGA